MGRAARAAMLVLASGLSATVAGAGIGTRIDVAAAAPVVAPPVAAVVVPARPGGTDPWLATVNWWRSFGGAADGSGAAFPAVNNLSSDNAGPQHQVDYLASIWRLGSTYCGHGEDPTHPRPPGDYTHNVLFCGPTSISEAVDGWMNTPYHAPPLLSPAVSRVGAGLATDGTHTGSAAGTFATTAIDRVYTWPANGGVMPRTEMTIKESPDPTLLCPPETGKDPGQPVFAWFPASRKLVSAVVTDTSGVVPSCVLSDNSQATRAAAAGDDLRTFIVLAKRPFSAASPATVSLITTDLAGGDRQTLSWSFTPLSTPDVVSASFSGHAGGATVNVAVPVGAQDGGTPILERQLVLYARSIGIVGDPVWRLPVAGAGVQEVAAPAGDYWACVIARNALGWSACATYVRVTVAEAPFTSLPTTAGFQPVDPVRLLDTREAGSAVPRLRAGRVAVLDLRSTMPPGAVAVALNLAAVGSAAAGWVRAYPCTSSVPETSNLNPAPGIVTTSATVVKLGDGRLCLQTLADTDLVIDLNGWLTPSSTAGLVTSAARRLLDTRPSAGPSRRLPPGGVIELPVVAAGSSTVAVSLNITAVDPAVNGFVTAWPCGSPQPFVANLNPSAGVTRPNLVNVRVGSAGSVCIYTTGETDLVVDLLGEYRPGAGARFAAIDPVRLVDTRVAPVAAAADGAALVASGAVVALQGTITAVTPAVGGYLAVYACTTQAWPGIANVNFAAGETSGNAVLMPASNNYTCVRNQAGAAFVVDVTGVWKSN